MFAVFTLLLCSIFWNHFNQRWVWCLRALPIASNHYFLKIPHCNWTLKFKTDQAYLPWFSFALILNPILNCISLYSRAAVLRGRVVTTSGRGLVGVRVTHADIHTEGYTMTQEDGWFDFMVNGGGAVTLTFGKSPFPPQVKTLFVSWNEVVVIGKANF